MIIRSRNTIDGESLGGHLYIFIIIGIKYSYQLGCDLEIEQDVSGFAAGSMKYIKTNISIQGINES